MNPESDNVDERPVKHLPGYATIGFLEFDDQGEPWRTPNSDDGWSPESSTQLPHVLSELKKQSATGPIRTVIFVHGWNNNAAPGNPNLADFERTLEEIGKVSKEPVFGVYVAWRGKIFERNSYIDIASREAAAERIGRSSLMASMRAISSATHNHSDSRVTAIGHSFGAKILVQITADHLAAQIGNRIGSSDATKASSIRPLADTVILANTAESAAIPLQLVNLMRECNVTYKNESNGRPLPLVISIWSPSDSATGTLLPIWNNIARNFIGLPSRGGGTANRIQDHSLYTAMGRYGPLISHQLVDENGQLAPSGKISWDTAQPWSDLIVKNREEGRKPLNDGGTFKLQLSPTADVNTLKTYYVNPINLQNFNLYGAEAEPNLTPFWSLQVPGWICSSHSDIWNPNFLGLVTAIEAMSAPSASQGRISERESVLEVSNLNTNSNSQ